MSSSSSNTVAVPSAASVRDQLMRSVLTPAAFRAALLARPATERDAWLDAVLGLEGVADDGADLPRECVPYLPCPVDVVAQAVERAGVGPEDVFVDLGAGPGRAAAAASLLSGARTHAVEIQRSLADSARALAQRFPALRLTVLHADAEEVAPRLGAGTVFFLYCPFSGDRLGRVLDALEPIARHHPIRLCCVDLPLPPRAWLTEDAPSEGPLATYRSPAAG